MFLSSDFQSGFQFTSQIATKLHYLKDAGLAQSLFSGKV